MEQVDLSAYVSLSVTAQILLDHCVPNMTEFKLLLLQHPSYIYAVLVSLRHSIGHEVAHNSQLSFDVTELSESMDYLD